MMRKRSGRIINISSVAGQIGNAGQTNYTASKAGQIGFTKALAREIASRNITVNGIAAGFVETDIWQGVPDEARELVMSLIPLGRKGEAEEIAYAVAFLASDQVFIYHRPDNWCRRRHGYDVANNQISLYPYL